jgi:predicted dehydrogenase
VAVCDVDTTRREHAKKLVDDKNGNSDCKAFVDYRELLAMKEIDAVVICTPDHWHLNQVLDSCAAGKDIYCEKPLTLNLSEGPRMIGAVRKHKRVFQTGSQQRTEFDGKFRTACEYVRSGRIGEVLTVHVGVPTSSVFCDLPEEKMEQGLDWDRWLGPAPVRPYNSVLSPRGIHTHYPQWRKYREYSGGGLTDMGAHNFDIAQWGLGKDESGPTEVIPPRDEKAEYGATLLYAGGPRVVHGGPDGITFIGTKGQIHVFRDRLSSIPDDILKVPLKDEDVKLPKAPSQIRNWLDCVKSREKPICDVEIGARSIACAHLCNLAYWHRKRLRWDPAKWEFVGDTEADEWREYERRKGYEAPKV